MCGRVSSHFQSIELLRCWCMLSAVLVLVQQNIMCGVKERGDGRKQKEGGGGGVARRGLFVTVNRLRVVHIIWPLMAAPPLL